MTDKHDDKSREIIKKAESWAELEHSIAADRRQVERETLERAAKRMKELAESWGTDTGYAEAMHDCYLHAAKQIGALIESEKVQEGE